MSPACSPRPGWLLSPVESEGGSYVGSVPAMQRTPQRIRLPVGLKAAALRGPSHQRPPSPPAPPMGRGQGAGVWAAGLAFDPQEPGAELRVPFSRPLAHGSLEQAEAGLREQVPRRPRCPAQGN